MYLWIYTSEKGCGYNKEKGTKDLIKKKKAGIKFTWAIFKKEHLKGQ